MVEKLSKYALKQLTDEERAEYNAKLEEEETDNTLYGSPGVRVEITYHEEHDEWLIAGYDPDDYQDTTNIEPTLKAAKETAQNMLYDLEEMYADYEEDDDEL